MSVKCKCGRWARVGDAFCRQCQETAAIPGIEQQTATSLLSVPTISPVAMRPIDANDAPRPKPIPTRAFTLFDPTEAFQLVRASLGDLAHAQLPAPEFNADQRQAPGAVRFVCISDTHSYESKSLSYSTAFESIPDGDVLLHCGDFTNVGAVAEVEAFAEWFARLPHKRKILIAGNHDLSLDRESYVQTMRARGMGDISAADATARCARARAAIDAIPGCEYLADGGTTVEGIRVWGSPWQPEFCEWAFNLPRGEACREKWRLIPDDTDVLLTHGPPLGHGDACKGGHRAGCLDLLHEVQTRVRPSVHVFGHVHEGAGVSSDGATLYVNASTCNFSYRPVNTALVVDVLPADPAAGRPRAQVVDVASCCGSQAAPRLFVARQEVNIRGCV